MDLDSLDPPRTPTTEDPTDVEGRRSSDVRRRVLDVVGARRAEPVDVRAYLLDPPATPEQVELAARRRRRVRHGSLAAAALVSVVLVAPWPGGAPGPSTTPAAPATTSSPITAAATDEPPSSTDAAAAGPVRLDRPAPRAARAATPRRTAVPRGLRVAPIGSRPTPAVTTSRPPAAAPPRASSAPTVAPRPAPTTASRPQASGAAAVLVPIL
jgi:hypothetical protein